MDDTPRRPEGDGTVTDLRSRDQRLYLWQVSEIYDGHKLGGDVTGSMRRAMAAMSESLRTAYDGGHIPLGWVVPVPTDRPVSFDEPVPVAVLATVDPDSGAVLVHDV